ncbi:MAG TPA: DUF134 domain-containing protein [bacterium]|nr:DUF134 domain-containing protein [bacterium]
MSRPRKCRYIETVPAGRCFKPCRSAGAAKNTVKIFLDEIEAIRLGDLEGLSQEEAAVKMGISRSTFARIINEAHAKIADAIVYSKPIVTEGGEQAVGKRIFNCEGCGHSWELECGAGCPGKCPECGGADFHRTDCGRRYQRRDSCGGDVSRNGGGGRGCCRGRESGESMDTGSKNK